MDDGLFVRSVPQLISPHVPIIIMADGLIKYYVKDNFDYPSDDVT